MRKGSLNRMDCIGCQHMSDCIDRIPAGDANKKINGMASKVVVPDEITFKPAKIPADAFITLKHTDAVDAMIYAWKAFADNSRYSKESLEAAEKKEKRSGRYPWGSGEDLEDKANKEYEDFKKLLDNWYMSNFGFIPTDGGFMVLIINKSLINQVYGSYNNKYDSVMAVNNELNKPQEKLIRSPQPSDIRPLSLKHLDISPSCKDFDGDTPRVKTVKVKTDEDWIVEKHNAVDVRTITMLSGMVKAFISNTVKCEVDILKIMKPYTLMSGLTGPDVIHFEGKLNRLSGSVIKTLYGWDILYSEAYHGRSDDGFSLVIKLDAKYHKEDEINDKN